MHQVPDLLSAPLPKCQWRPAPPFRYSLPPSARRLGWAFRRRHNRMLTVGDKFPEFKLKGVVSLEKGKEFKDFDHKTFKGRWTVLFAWPKDFTFICPTEIAEFG